LIKKLYLTIIILLKALRSGWQLRAPGVRSSYPYGRWVCAVVLCEGASTTEAVSWVVSPRMLPVQSLQTRANRLTPEKNFPGRAKGYELDQICRQI
jgi:hypothetical protein